MSVICLNTFREHRTIRTVGPLGAPAEIQDGGWSFGEIRDQVIARFGDKGVPAFVMKAWLRKSKEPYRFGSTCDCQWRTFREAHWNKPFPFPMDMDPSVEVIGKRVKDGGMDPCAWLDMKYQVTLNHIRIRHGKPLVIHTRSDLIAHDDYIEALDPHHHRVVMYVLDATDEVVREWEPGAPSLKRRRIAVDKLISRGIPVQVVHISASVLSKRGAI